MRDVRSVWADTMPEGDRVVGVPLPGDTEADVAIVGAGLTGLWTAWSLLRRDPSMRVAVIERDTIGFGASGRNGGWCSALLPMSLSKLARAHGEDAARRMQRAMHATVRDVGSFVDESGVDCWYQRGGTLVMARNRPQVDRLRSELAEYAEFGFGQDDYRWLDAAEATEICAATAVHGALWTPHCAVVHPLRLTHAVAAAVLAAGGRVHEGVTARSIDSGRVETDHGTVRADVVVRATEGYTSGLQGERRTLLPIYSLMVATDPLPDELWRQIGLEGRPTFSDARHMIIYGQRTADGRIAFGGRGAPYHFGSAVRPEFDTDDRVRRLLTTGLHELFPPLAEAGVEPTHHWGGVLGAARDWTCSVRYDRRERIATAGGYVGDGVSTTHLAGRTLAALITGSDDDADRELVELPWVGHRSRKWEPEPLRWIGVNAARGAAQRADRAESAGKRSKLWGGVVDALLGH